MRTALYALSAAAVAAASLSAAQAQTQVNLAETAPIVTLSMSEMVESAPDIANVSAGVQTRAPTAKEAMAMNATQMSAVIARIEKSGIAKKDIQTSGITLTAQYDYANQNPNGGPSVPRFIGYEVSNTVNVRTRDIKGIGSLLDALVASGATNISGPSFGIEKPEPLLVKARETALKKARAQAEFYANQTGYRSVRLVSINDGGNSGGMPPMPMLQFAKAERAMDTPVAPGQVTTGVTLTVQFALEK